MKRRSKRNWYKPAGTKVNRILDAFEQQMAYIHREFIRQANTYLTQMKPPGKISCVAGCHYCCRCAFVITLLEGVCIARHLEVHWPREDRTGLAKTLNEHRKLQQTGGAYDWWKLQRDCAFLRDGRCDIYRVRPLNCRLNCAITPPEYCKGLGKAQLLDPSEAMNWRIGAAEKAIRQLADRDEVLIGPMPSAVELGLQALYSGDFSIHGKEPDKNFMTRWDAEVGLEAAMRKAQKDNRANGQTTEPQDEGVTVETEATTGETDT